MGNYQALLFFTQLAGLQFLFQLNIFFTGTGSSFLLNLFDTPALAAGEFSLAHRRIIGAANSAVEAICYTVESRNTETERQCRTRAT